jgi:PAS domain S-box-containing protein
MNDLPSVRVPAGSETGIARESAVKATPAILLVDDQPARLLSYEAALSGLRVECVCAMSGEEALAHLMKQDFAAILLDVNMPGMDGFETARLVRTHPRFERTPIIFVTGVNVCEVDELKGYEVGAIDYLPVPVVPEILRSKVAILVEIYQRRRELEELNRALQAGRQRLGERSSLKDALRASEARCRLEAEARRRAEEALRESEQRHRGLIEQSQERLLLAQQAAQLGTFDYDMRHDRLSWDARLRELWGIPLDEPATFQAALGGMHADDRPRILRALEQALDPAGDGSYFAAYRVINRVDGVTRWIEARGRAHFKDGVAVRLIGMVKDVTEQKRREEELLASEARFRDLANNIDQFAWVCDEFGDTQWYNDRWYQYTGMTFEDVQGDGWQKVHHPEHLPRVVSRLTQSLRSGSPWEDTYPLRGKDGQYRWFLSRAVPIHDANGRIRRWVGTNTDVTDLRTLQEALKEADHRKDEFLAMLAHELRNPLAPICTAAQILLMKMSAADPDRRLAEMIQRQSRQLTRLVDDLLDVARITQGRIELSCEKVAVSASLELALETVAPLIEQKKHVLRVTQPAEPVFVMADTVRLAQCFTTLLANAAKYTQEGGNVFVRVSSCEDRAVIEVGDDGIGMSQEFIARAFELFVQSERSLDRSQGGLGIGLAICKRLVEMHGGTVQAESGGPLRGSKFTIRLPLG